mmetsp:Transcript_77061/g.152699  ORF Transcript_77061/g.152699 Transcript_77061/m.152699 type:complete len:131 (+) Transcript_77061:58-450(+)
MVSCALALFFAVVTGSSTIQSVTGTEQTCSDEASCKCLLDCEVFADIRGTVDNATCSAVVLKKMVSNSCAVGSCMVHCAHVCGTDSQGLENALRALKCTLSSPALTPDPTPALTPAPTTTPTPTVATTLR